VAIAIGRVGYEERLSVVDHLEELRTRLIVSLAAIAVAFGFCLWQNHALLHIIDKPLAHQTQKQVRAGNGPLGATYSVQQSARVVASQLQVVVATLDRPGSGASAATRASLHGVTPALQRSVTSLFVPAHREKPATLRIGEPFTATVGIALIFALVLALPVVLYQLYSFLLPALSPHQQRSATLLVLPIPLLFIAGVVFGYFVVLPAAVRFFQNFKRRRVQRAREGEPVLPLRSRDAAHDGRPLPGPRRDPRGHPRGRCLATPAPPQPPLRAARVRPGCGIAPRRCRHRPARDSAALPPLRGELAAGHAPRAPRRAPRTRCGPDGVPVAPTIVSASATPKVSGRAAG
jgi:Sec-independent protein secretion pathway component TatC